MFTPSSYAVFPLGDAALLIDFGNVIDQNINQKVLLFFHMLQNDACPYIKDIVPAYASLAVYYDVVAINEKSTGKTAFETMAEIIDHTHNKHLTDVVSPGRLLQVPVCYAQKFAVDIQYIAEQKNITAEEIIHLHTSKIYNVFMIGFLPGFAYMGIVDEKIMIPRKPQPNQVAAGSVGIAGFQTGIYPLNTPGGWQIIGRTPLKIFDKNKEQPVLLQAGDQIKFYPITEDEFANY